MSSSAWHVIGLAVRYAHSRALHLINDSPETTDAQRELEARIWHTLCALELLVCFLTGRPAAIEDRHSSTRLPMPIEDHVALGFPHGLSPLDFANQTTTSPTYSFTSALGLASEPLRSTAMVTCRASLQLDRILAEVLSELYSASTVRSSWANVQRLISKLNSKLANWRSDLPSMLLIDHRQNDKAPLSERMYLALRYFSTSMMINRPCLCEISSHRTALSSQSAPSEQADRHAAAQCIESARGLLRLLPDEPDVIGLYTSSPWWCTLHYIVQAGTVLVLEIGFAAAHLPDERQNIIQAAGKVIKWLQKLAETSIAAARAWMALSRVFHLSISKIGQNAEAWLHFMPRDMSLPSLGIAAQRSQHPPAPPPTTPAAFGASSLPQTSRELVSPYVPLFPLYDFWDLRRDEGQETVLGEALAKRTRNTQQRMDEDSMFPGAGQIPEFDIGDGGVVQ